MEENASLQALRLEATFDHSGDILHCGETWRRVHSLGSGAFGTVWKEECVSGLSHRVKQLRAVKQTPRFQRNAWQRELQALHRFSQHNDHFVQCFGWFECPENFYIAMEFVPYGSLQSHIIRKPLPEQQTILVTVQIAQALRYMHQSNFIHRDLKPLNILVSRPGPDWHVKVADFGISKDITGSAQSTVANVGTLSYMAPEILLSRNGRYTPAVDIWSLGAVTFCLLTKNPPFPNIPDILDFARETSPFPTQPLRKCSFESVEFIKSTMKPNRDARLTIDQVLSHTWLSTKSAEDSDTEGEDNWEASNRWTNTFDPASIRHDSGISMSTVKAPDAINLNLTANSTAYHTSLPVRTKDISRSAEYQSGTPVSRSQPAEGGNTEQMTQKLAPLGQSMTREEPKNIADDLLDTPGLPIPEPAGQRPHGNVTNNSVPAYALHTSVGTIAQHSRWGNAGISQPLYVGQDSALLVLNASKHDHWLVKVVKSGQEGYIDMKSIETAASRFVRLSIEKNIGFSLTPKEEDEAKAKATLAAATSKKSKVSDGGDIRQCSSDGQSTGGDTENTIWTRNSITGKWELASQKDKQPDPKKQIARKPVDNPLRTWKERDGAFETVASFRRLDEDTNKVILHKINGVTIAVPVTKLSIQDQKYVESLTGMSLGDRRPLERPNPPDLVGNASSSMKLSSETKRMKELEIDLADPAVQAVLQELQKAGITEDQIEKNADFIKGYLEQNRAKAAAQAEQKERTARVTPAPPPPPSPFAANLRSQNPGSMHKSGTGLVPAPSPSRKTPSFATKRIEQSEIDRYWETFWTIGKGSSYIDRSGMDRLFRKSQLPDDQKGHIWSLADIDEDGRLDFKEFCVGLHLMYEMMTGEYKQVPQTLPDWLVPEGKTLRQQRPGQPDKVFRVAKEKAPSCAIALFDYEAGEDNELSFPSGAKIMDLEFPDEDWWLGTYKGVMGLFPANYVRLMTAGS